MQAAFLAPQSAADGTSWTACGDAITRYNRLHVLNNTGTALQFRRAGAPTVFFTLKDGQAWSFAVIYAANLEFRRVDTSTTQITLNIEAELN